jgi:hypothetical protein
VDARRATHEGGHTHQASRGAGGAPARHQRRQDGAAHRDRRAPGNRAPHQESQAPYPHHTASVLRSAAGAYGSRGTRVLATCNRHPQYSQERTPPKGSRERAVRHPVFCTADACSVRAVRVCTAFGVSVFRVVSGSSLPWNCQHPSLVASASAGRPMA